MRRIYAGILSILCFLFILIITVGMFFIGNPSVIGTILLVVMTVVGFISLVVFTTDPIVKVTSGIIFGSKRLILEHESGHTSEYRKIDFWISYPDMNKVYSMSLEEELDRYYLMCDDSVNNIITL